MAKQDDDNVPLSSTDFGDCLAEQTSPPPGKHKSDMDRSPSMLDAIQHYLDSVEGGEEFTPDAVGRRNHGYERRKIINAALALSITKAIRHCNRKSSRVTGLLFYVAVRSDNEHGRCSDSAKRIAGFLDCGEDAVRDIRDALVRCGALRAEKRPQSGLSVPLWLPYVRQTLEFSDFAILGALAPPRFHGRPKTRGTIHPPFSGKSSGIAGPTFSTETPGIADEEISKKGWVLLPKTSGVDSEKIGCPMPDTKNSIQQHYSRTQVKEAPAANGLSQTIPDNKVESVWEIVPSVSELLWRALEGQGLSRSKALNEEAFKQTLSECPWIARLSPSDARRLAETAATAMVKTNNGFWPTAAELSECARTYLIKLEDRERKLKDHALALAAYEKRQKARADAKRIADPIAAKYPEPVSIEPTFDDLHRHPSSDQFAERQRRMWHVDKQNAEARSAWREQIRNAQIAAGVDPELVGGPECPPPSTPEIAEILFVWPSRGRSRSF